MPMDCESDRRRLMDTLNGITELEEDVLIYGICNARQPPFLRSRKRSEVLRWARIIEPELFFMENPLKMSDIGKYCKMTKTNQLSGVISSLSKKGLITCETRWGDREVTVTKKGLWVLKNI